MPDAAFFRSQAEKTRKLAEDSRIPAIQRRLVVLAEQYRAQASAMTTPVAVSAATPSPDATSHPTQVVP